jgi:ABC-type Na+ transport system ATPase subunit NatA
LRYKSFRIQNFKGIKDTTVQLQGIAGANVFAFVGLNESGKTTLLEAIHSFSPDKATNDLQGGEIGVPLEDRVPRHRISDFTGDACVSATLSVTQTDKKTIAKQLFADHKIIINIDGFPDEIIFDRVQRFENGDFKNSYLTLRRRVKVRTGKHRNWRDWSDDERFKIRNVVYQKTPEIAYFPTLVFNFPTAIYLTDRGGAIHQFYRRVFQDILDHDNRGHTIEKDIVRRVRSEKLIAPWLSFLTAWSGHDDREKIQHVMDRASAAVTRLVFGRWNQIFKEDVRGKEVAISYEVVEGEIKNAEGNKEKTQSHDVLIKFQIRDGSRRFDVNDRSLGFRWFFSFMLFTQFRVARSDLESRPLLFLFDEPAANLHAAAQQKLIESFPEIAKREHVLAYSTHSHYMIEPKWLEQTFIVTNRADAPSSSSMLDAISLDDESLNIQATPYRSFVNSHPGQTSYFQPILDRLEVVPSRFDAQKASVVLEGKSDYHILRYALRMLGIADFPLLPGLGAGTFGALAALHVGWNLNFLFVLDGDRQGQVERKRYHEDFGIPLDRIMGLAELVSGVTVIEDLLDDEARAAIKKKLKLSTSPSKGQIRRFFQEQLASDQTEPLSTGFAEKAKSLIDALRLRLSGTS